jgi:hypothetical protein
MSVLMNVNQLGKKTNLGGNAGLPAVPIAIGISEGRMSDAGCRILDTEYQIADSRYQIPISPCKFLIPNSHFPNLWRIF